MPGRAVRLLIAVALLCIVAPVGVPRPAAAQDTVEFLTVEATADFPESIHFNLQARSSSDIGAVQVFWKPVSSVAASMAEVDFTNGEILEASHTVDMTIQYLPPGLDLIYYWRVSTSDGRVHTSPEETLFYMDNRFEWQSVEAGLVTVWWYGGSEDYAANIAHSANRTLVLLESGYGLQTTEKIRLLAYATSAGFSSALRANSAEWIGGVAHSSLSLILGHIAPGSTAERETNRMIPHEISHVVVAQASSNPYNGPPPWLDEGLATYIQDAPDSRLAPILDRAVREGRLIPIGALQSSFPVDPDQAMLSYAESESIVAYLVETYGQEAVGELVTIYRQEVRHDEALERVLGISVEELDAAWKAWLGYEGDRVEDPFIAASDPEGPGLPWFLVFIGAALLFAVGMVAFFFWRTRSYNETDEPDEASQPQT